MKPGSSKEVQKPVDKPTSIHPHPLNNRFQQAPPNLAITPSPYFSFNLGNLQQQLNQGYQIKPLNFGTVIKRKSNCDKIYNSDQNQYIKRRRLDASASNSTRFLYSGKLFAGGVEWKFHEESGLLTSANRFVAQVTIEKRDELDCAVTFDHATQALEKNLRVQKILVDDDMLQMNKLRKACDDHLRMVFADTIDNRSNAEDLFQLERILRCYTLDVAMSVELKHITLMSSGTKQVISECIGMEIKQTKRNCAFNIKLVAAENLGSKRCIEILQENVVEGICNHRAKAVEMAAVMMRSHLEKLSDRRVLFVTRQDLKLISDLFNTLDRTCLEPMLSALVQRYFTVIDQFDTDSLQSTLPISNNIFFYLCKSTIEVFEEITKKLFDTHLLNYNCETGWQESVAMEWIYVPSTLDKSLEYQIKMLLKLLNHFEVARSSSCERFLYEFKVFESIEANPKNRQMIEQANAAFGCERNDDLLQLPDELHVWICLLDDTIAQLFVNNQQIKKLSSDLFKLFINFVLSDQMTVDSMESVRVLTHNTIRFIAQARPIINPENDQSNYILEKQINYMNRALLEGRMSFENYRDLIEVFAQYWVQRSDVTDGVVVKRPEQCIEQNENEIKSQLLQCMARALDKNVKVVDLINFCRVYDELLVDLRNLPLEWFVRLPAEDYTDIFINKSALSIVQNKWMGSERQCYSVENVSRFKRLYLALFDEPKLPRHFLFETIKSLLTCIIDLETKEQWTSGGVLTETDQLNAAGLLIASIRSSLLYLKEQPDYINFDEFFEESTKPFIIVTNESISYEDFEKRINIVKESFWYFRKSNEIDIGMALSFYKECNESNYNGERLRYCYCKYNEKFDELMSKQSNIDTVAKIASIVADVTRETNSTKLTTQWNTDFKSNKLPAILAGLSAVWALHVSKDVARTGQYLKPHCIQILCVLRLLSADRDDQGVRKHLAQVLTGQGKSLVLALVASVLALCGHSVQIMCYIKYLATRDGKEFEDFYGLFGIHAKISYQTFEEAAKERLNQLAGNVTQYVHSCIGLPNVKSCAGVTLPNPVLLIDEVDVLFDEKLYGETYNMGTFPRIPGLDKIQLFIWKMAQQNCTNIRKEVDIYLKNESDPQIAMFNRLINKPGNYTLLIHCGDQNVGKTFTNSSLFSLHIDKMIAIAKQVYTMEPTHSVFNEFRLNSTGKIAVKQSFGNYSETTYKNYYNTFIYFRLKGTNFEEGKTNYGYLNFRLGSVSYAKIPEDFSLILGVTGTLTSLSSYEKKVVNDHYNITEMTVMPSFFGGSNLKFNETVDFNCFNTATEWTNAIFGRINAIVNAKRSVLVIFNSDVEINAFKQQFAAQLDRLNVLTVDTDPADKERFINDAGVSRTITLATREMGRGVDYKSSVAVEKNGGVHVIQCFFSKDVKEETQIKGRTARKDNRGSYELIVRVDDLRKENFVDSQESCLTVTYNQLNDKRKVQMMVKDESRVEKLKVANKNHQGTVDFYRNK